MSEGTVEAALAEWAAAIARERERRHFTIEQHRNLYGNDWPAGIARTQSKADDAIDDALAALRSRGSSDTRLTELEADLEHQSERRAYWRDRAEAAERVVAAARAENAEAHHGRVTERTRAILNNALLDYDAALAAARADAPQEGQA